MADKRLGVTNQSNSRKGEQFNYDKSYEMSHYEPSYNEAEKQHDEDVDIPVESKISKTLSDKNTRIVIMMVLILLIILPLLTSDIYV